MRWPYRVLLGLIMLLGGHWSEGPTLVYAEEDPGWAVNPLTSKFFSAEYFPSSRFGQLFVPEAAAQLGNTTVMRLNQALLGPLTAGRLNSLSGDYLAHFGWRLGCDQGYLMAQELSKNQFASNQDYFLGHVDDVRKPQGLQKYAGEKLPRHPALIDHYDARVTVGALLAFAVGQVIGQRYFGPQVKAMLGKVKIKNRFFDPNRPMGFWSSQIFYDQFGWPNGRINTRADAISKIAGIFLGSYLGWALNDVGWQMAHWQRFSLDPFQAYLPEFSVGEQKFGSIDGGWGILGFTIGGFTGHNLGSALADYSLQRYGRPGGLFLKDSPVRWAEATENARIRQQFKKTTYELSRTGLGLKWTSAIAGNFILGVTLTTYCPHLYRKLHALYTTPAVVASPPDESVLLDTATLQQRLQAEIKNRLMIFLQQQLKREEVQALLDQHLPLLSPEDNEKLASDLAGENAQGPADSAAPELATDAPPGLTATKIMQEYGPMLVLLAQQMGNTLTYLVGAWMQESAEFSHLADLRQYFAQQLQDFLPPEIQAPLFYGGHFNERWQNLRQSLRPLKDNHLAAEDDVGVGLAQIEAKLLGPVSEAAYVAYLKQQAANVIRPLYDLALRKISGMQFLFKTSWPTSWEEASRPVQDLAALADLLKTWPATSPIPAAAWARGKQAWQSIAAKANPTSMLHFYRARFIQGMIELHPLLFRINLERKLQLWWQDIEVQDDVRSIVLKTQEQILRSEWKFLQHLPLQDEQRAKLQQGAAALTTAKHRLLSDNPEYYVQHPDLLAEYQQSLDELLRDTEKLKAAALKDMGMQELGTP